MMIIKAKAESSLVPTAERRLTEPVETEEKELTVRVCLRRMFGSNRARCVLRVERERPASWLVQRVRALFPPAGAAAGHLVLVSGGYVLPPNEPLAVLAPGDLVEIIPLHKNYGDEDERKFYENFTSAFSGVPAAQRDCVITEIQSPDKKSVNECGVIQPDLELESSEDQLQEMKRRALLLLDEYHESNEPYSVAETEERIKRRRRRVRRRRAPHSPLPTPEGGCHSSSPTVQQNAGATVRAPRCVRAGSSTGEQDLSLNTT